MVISLLGLFNMLYLNYSNQLLKDAIKGIVQFQEEQIKQWESLSIDITALKQGPIFSAKIFLNDATKEHRNEKECRELIEKAKEKFIDALGILKAKTEKDFWDFHQIGMVQYFISLCWLLLIQNEDAEDWLQLSLETVIQN